MARQPPTPPVASPLDLQRRWAETFRAYLAERDESGLGAAYALGRQAVAANLSALDLAEAHHAALAEALRGVGDADRRADVVDAAGAFFREGASVFQIAREGYEEVQEEARLEHEHVLQLRALADASVAINASLTLEEVLQLTADAARGVVHAARATVTSRPADPLGPSLAASSPAHDDAGPNGKWSELTIVLMRRGRELGSLAVMDRRERAFTPRDEAILTQLAHLAAVAIANAELYERQLSIAQKLQRSLRPGALPAIPGLAAGVRFIAAGEGVEVGGDFYELFPTGEDAAVALIGDVCGKGPDAAAVSALARHTLRTAAQYERRPAAVLALLHQALHEHGGGDRFCTVAYAQLTIAAQAIRMQLVCGGHPLPLVVHADGSVEPVGRLGTLVGSFAEPDLREATVELRPGDACVLFTDGVTEVRRHRTEVFGPTELEGLLTACGGLAPEEIAERIEDAVLRASAGTLRDDIAVLVIAPAGTPAMLSAAGGRGSTTSMEEVDGPEA